MPERGYYNWTPLGTGLITETSSLAAAGGESQSSVTLSSPPICSLLLYWPSNINQLINKQKVGNYRWKCKSKSADRLPSVSYSCVSCFMSLLSLICLYPLPPLHWWRWWMYWSSFRLPFAYCCSKLLSLNFLQSKNIYKQIYGRAIPMAYSFIQIRLPSGKLSKAKNKR